MVDVWQTTDTTGEKKAHENKQMCQLTKGKKLIIWNIKRGKSKTTFITMQGLPFTG